MKCLEITLDNAMYCQKLVFDNLSFICHKALDKSQMKGFIFIFNQHKNPTSYICVQCKTLEM